MNSACVDCICSTLGYKCDFQTCGCPDPAACQNPFNKIDVPSIFGLDPVALHECFITWVLRQNEVRPEQIDLKFLFNLALRNFHQIGDITEDHEPYVEWRTRWDALSEREQNHNVELQQEMNRMAFTKDYRCQNMNIFLSLCRQSGQWEGNDVWHCKMGGECVD